nr:hypothetical protein CFP56_25671 [Quercus suber]
MPRGRTRPDAARTRSQQRPCRVRPSLTPVRLLWSRVGASQLLLATQLPPLTNVPMLRSATIVATVNHRSLPLLVTNLHHCQLPLNRKKKKYRERNSIFLLSYRFYLYWLLDEIGETHFGF